MRWVGMSSAAWLVGRVSTLFKPREGSSGLPANWPIDPTRRELLLSHGLFDIVLTWHISKSK